MVSKFVLVEKRGNTFGPDIIWQGFYHVYSSHFFHLALKLETLAGQARSSGMEALSCLEPPHRLERRPKRPERSFAGNAPNGATSHWQSKGSSEPYTGHHFHCLFLNFTLKMPKMPSTGGNVFTTTDEMTVQRYFIQRPFWTWQEVIEKENKNKVFSEHFKAQIRNLTSFITPIFLTGAVEKTDNIEYETILLSYIFTTY